MSSPAPAISLTDRTILAAHRTLAGQCRGVGAWLPFAGPAIMASVAYLDPGNFATNIQAGAGYGYSLLWVVLVANVMAMLFQAMSAKLGIVTGRNLAELCREQFPPAVVAAMWLSAELAAMATDLAEFLGGAIGLSLLLHLPMMMGMGITALATWGALMLERRGFRPLELLISALVGVIGMSYLFELAIARTDWGAALRGMAVPSISDHSALTLAVGIVGATIMPHVIYLHSGLTQSRLEARNDRERRVLVRFSNREVMIALGFAGLVNMAMVVMAASVFHQDHREIAQIETAYRTLIPLLGGGAAGVFLLSLMASGISSSAIGTLAGQVVMQGFVGFAIPLWLRRLLTMAPAFLVIGLGCNATRTLVISQVVLSLILPVPMLSLLAISRKRSVMGDFALSGPMTALAGACTAVVLLLNGFLLVQMLGCP